MLVPSLETRLNENNPIEDSLVTKIQKRGFFRKVPNKQNVNLGKFALHYMLNRGSSHRELIKMILNGSLIQNAANAYKEDREYLLENAFSQKQIMELGDLVGTASFSYGPSISKSPVEFMSTLKEQLADGYDVADDYETIDEKVENISKVNWKDVGYKALKIGVIAGGVLVIGYALVGGATAAYADFPAIQITSDTAVQYELSMSGDRIVWCERSGNWDIYMWDPNNGVQPVCTHPAIQLNPNISGDRIVWQDDRNAPYSDIYMWDPNNGEQQITTDPDSQYVPDISGDKIVWIDSRNNGIYMLDLKTMEEQPVGPNPGWQDNPSISGDVIVWEDYRNHNDDIYMYDLFTGEETQITTDPGNQRYPLISGNRIVWTDWRDGDSHSGTNPDIYMWNPNNGEQPLCADPNSKEKNPAISGDKIAWQDNRNGNWNIYMWDPVYGERAVCTHPAIQYTPGISGNKIIWIDFRNGNPDIYMAEIPQPDLNDDGIVNFKDYAILTIDWQETGPRLKGDIHKDDKVDYKDLRTLVENWLCGYHE